MTDKTDALVRWAELCEKGHGHTVALELREALAAPAEGVDVERLRVLLDRIKAAAKNIDHSPAPLHEGKAIIIGAASMALEMIDSAGGAKCTGADCKPRDGGTLCQSCGGDITPQPAEGDGAVDPADWPECSGNPGSCPENEGYGCCKPNSEAVEDQPPHGFIKVRDAIRGVVAVSKVFPGDIIAEEYETRPAATAQVPEGYALIAKSVLREWGKLDEVREACRFETAPAAPKGWVVDEATVFKAADALVCQWNLHYADAERMASCVLKAAALATGEQP